MHDILHASSKVAQNGLSTSQDVDFDGSLLPLLSVDVTIMVLKNCSIIGEHVGIIFVTH